MKASLKILFSLLSSISCDCIESVSKPSAHPYTEQCTYCSVHSFIGKQAGGINNSPLFTLGSKSTDANGVEKKPETNNLY